MPGIVTNQIADGAVTPAKVDLTSAYTWTGAHDFSTGGSSIATTPDKLQVTGTPNSANDAANKAYVDAVASGLQWKNPVAARNYVGTYTVAELDAGIITGLAAGVTVVMSSAGTPAAGTSDLLAIGDIAEFDGTQWKLILGQVGGFPESGARLAIADDASGYTLSEGAASDLVDATDKNKIAEFDGASLAPATKTASTTGDAILVNGQGANNSVDENAAFTYDGAPLAGWTQFTGSGGVGDGAGLSFSGNTLNVGDVDKGIQVNANDLEFSAVEVLEAGTGLKVGTLPHQLNVEPADFAGTGLEDDGADNLRLSIQGNGIAGGAGTTLSVKEDVVGGVNLATVVDVNSNGVAIRVEDNYITENAAGDLSLTRLPTNDGPANGTSSVILTCTLASVTGTFVAGETVTQTTSGAAGILVSADIQGADLLLHILTTTPGWAITAGYNVSGASGDTVIAPTAVSVDNSPDGAKKSFALSLPGSTALEDSYLAETLQVFRNGVLQYMAGYGDGTANDDIIGGANVDYFYYHDATSATPGEVEFQVAPAAGELINIFYDGYLVA